MRNWYVYRGGVFINCFDSENQAVQWVIGQITAARQQGAKGHPEYKVSYNGTGEVTYKIPQMEFANVSSVYPSDLFTRNVLPTPALANVLPKGKVKL